jgi:hypothetical protein
LKASLPLWYLQMPLTVGQAPRHPGASLSLEFLKVLARWSIVPGASPLPSTLIDLLGFLIHALWVATNDHGPPTPERAGWNDGAGTCQWQSVADNSSVPSSP